jgi:hypothetical protein
MAKIYRPPQLEENSFFCDHCNHEVSFQRGGLSKLRQAV